MAGRAGFPYAILLPLRPRKVGPGFRMELPLAIAGDDAFPAERWGAFGIVRPKSCKNSFYSQRRNSREAAEQLIQTYYDEIYRFVYRQTGSKEDAMDLTQSVFIAVLRALPGYRAERASFRTWLYRIAANKVIDTRRKARPVSIPIQEMELPAAEDFVARVHDRALLETIEGYVSGLDPGEQAVFRLRIYGEKTFPEIAAAMGEPEAAVKSRYYRLIGRLRKEFGADG